jgi:hypothetical protein
MVFQRPESIMVDMRAPSRSADILSIFVRGRHDKDITQAKIAMYDLSPRLALIVFPTTVYEGDKNID